MIDRYEANRRRDRRLRRKLLSTLHLARTGPRGGIGGRTLFDLVDGVVSSDQRFEDDDHAMGLLRDLTDSGLVAVEILPRRRSQRDGIEFRFYRITSSGTQIIEEAAPPNPLVDDERVTEES